MLQRNFVTAERRLTLLVTKTLASSRTLYRSSFDWATADHVTRLLGLALTIHVIVTLEPTTVEYSSVWHVTTGATAHHYRYR